MNARVDSWSEDDVDFLSKAWGRGMSSDDIARTLGRTREAVDGKRKKLALGSRDVNHIRRAKLKELALERADEPRPIEKRDEEHWRACLAAGGFPVSVRIGENTVHLYPMPEVEAA